jgi:hypothetical protein
MGIVAVSMFADWQFKKERVFLDLMIARQEQKRALCCPYSQRKNARPNTARINAIAERIFHAEAPTHPATFHSLKIRNSPRGQLIQ